MSEFCKIIIKVRIHDFNKSSICSIYHKGTIIGNLGTYICFLKNLFFVSQYMFKRYTIIDYTDRLREFK